MSICALSESGVGTCWGKNKPDHLQDPELTLKHFRNIQHIAIGGSHLCTISREFSRPKCEGGDYSSYEIEVPTLLSPKLITAGRRHTCALDQQGVKCWGNNKFGQINVPLLQNPRQVTAGRNHTCALDDTGVKCWGQNTYGESQVPVLRNPKLIAAGENYTCAVDHLGVNCWGKEDLKVMTLPENVEGGSVSVPTDRFLADPAQYLSKILIYFPKNKAGFLQDSVKLAIPLAIPPDASVGLSYHKYLELLTLYEFSLPLLEETTSFIVQKKVLPKHQEALALLRKKMGKQGCSEIEPTPRTVSLVLSLSVSALAGSKPYLVETDSQKDLEIMQLKLGSTIARIQGKGRLRDDDMEIITTLYQDHLKLIQSLLISEKTYAYGQVLVKAQTYFNAQ